MSDSFLHRTSRRASGRPMSSLQSTLSSKPRWIVAIVVLLSFFAMATPSANASGVEGTWKIRDLVLDIFDCDKLVCGRVVWMRDPQRRSANCGRTIVWGLLPNGAGQWTGGSILDPDDRSTYSLSATLQPDGMLNARIYSGIALFGKTEILQRVPARSLDGWC